MPNYQAAFDHILSYAISEYDSAIYAAPLIAARAVADAERADDGNDEYHLDALLTVVAHNAYVRACLQATQEYADRIAQAFETYKSCAIQAISDVTAGD